MKKHFRLIFYICYLVATFFAFSSCVENQGKDDEFMKNHTSNEISQSGQSLYSINELVDYFGKSGLQGNEANQNCELLLYEDVNKVFPIENTKEGVYSYYNVKEGGRFYIFWSKIVPFSESMAFGENSVETNDCVSFTAYLTPSSIKSKEDFNSVRCDMSTANDVRSIDPNAEFCYLLSSGVRSYSLLKSGEVLEILYYHSNESNMSDLVVKEISVVDKSKSSSLLAKITDNDLWN